MKKLITALGIGLLIGLISACTGNSTPSANESEIAQLVEVDISLPEKISPNEESDLKVKVTQAGESIEDADDIQFEVWKMNDKEESEMIKATHEKGGVYSIRKTFKEAGIYYVQTHVTARDMHVMPKKQFIVGNISKKEMEKIKQMEEESDQEGESRGHHH
ncbi:FixH family protein [Rossellomorea aquimaris]|nr:FixH family protein [Rossellomorea aquimaris]WRP08661.1 FixH family protein [Rossellomorea aquimaris]